MFDSFLKLFSQSYFVAPLALCSLIGLGVIIHRLLALRTGLLIPDQLSRFVAEDRQGDAGAIRAATAPSSSSFARVVLAATEDHPSREAAEHATQAVAREEIVKMQRGLPTLEVIFTISPLLGLLGTVSGLVRVFSTLGLDDGTPSTTGVALGISEALWTTILGLAIAVPAVIAHSFFQRKIEKLAARMEVLAQNLILRLYRS